jgi:hypothetical protein
VQPNRRVHLALSRDGFATSKPIRFDDNLHEITFNEVLTNGNSVRRLAAGDYETAVEIPVSGNEVSVELRASPH